MKTFKLISLHITGDHGLIEIKLEDGLIINKEDENRTWLLEALVPAAYEDYFQSLLEEKKDLILQIVISRKANDPAYYHSKLFHIKKLDNDSLSLLFKGQLNRSRSNYAEQVLANLLEEGFTGQELLKQFKKHMRLKSIMPSVKK
jgi:YwpF-like protein